MVDLNNEINGCFKPYLASQDGMPVFDASKFLPCHGALFVTSLSGFGLTTASAKLAGAAKALYKDASADIKVRLVTLRHHFAASR